MLGRIRSARRAASSLHLTPGSSSNSRSTISAAAVHRQLLQHRPTVAAALPSSSSHFFSTTSAPLSSAFLKSYDEHVAERAAMANGKLGGIAPKPLDAAQTATLIEELRAVSSSSSPEAERLVELLSHRVPPGVDEAAYVKAAYLSAVALGKESPTLISRLRAVELLGTMQGGYNVGTLVELLSGDDAELKASAAHQLKHTLLVFDAFHDVVELYNGGNEAAKEVLESWAAAEWFTSKPDIPEKITVTVFK
eukprot:scaffold4037_cov145-Skeletonema_marinoi.AAC.14